MELAALVMPPSFLWFVPDRMFFFLNAFFYVLSLPIVGMTCQGMALKFSDGRKCFIEKEQQTL